jgi:2-C-methyl-D-erythritol 4-phosphate cytidylyltransferase
VTSGGAGAPVGASGVGVVIAASGMGRRMGGVRKPFLALADEPILLWAIRPFLEISAVTVVVVALPAEVAADPPAWLLELDPRIRIAAGGETRRQSVWNSLQSLPPGLEVIAVHDAARPLIDENTIRRCIASAQVGEGAVAGVPSADTLKRVDGEHRVVETPDRAELWQAQTPQVFPRDLLMNAYRRADEENWTATDDASLVERIGGTVRMVETSGLNMKVTRPEDLALVEAFLEKRP